MRRYRTILLETKPIQPWGTIAFLRKMFCERLMEGI